MPPVTRPCSSAGMACRYELSFEIRLSVSNSPFGSDSCSLSAANALTFCVAVLTGVVTTAVATTAASNTERFAQSCNPVMLQFCNTMGAVAEVFSITLVFPAMDDPDFQRALDLARQSSDFLETGTGRDARYRATFHVRDAARLLDVFYVVRQSHRLEILVNDQRVPYGRELWIPLVSFFAIPYTRGQNPPPTPGHFRRRAGHAEARGRHEGPRGAIQHVLRRAPAEAAMGSARRRRGAREALRPRVHPELRRALPLRHAAVAVSDADRPLGQGPARARRRPAGAVRAEEHDEGRAEEAAGPHPARDGVQQPDARAGQAARSVRVARRGAARGRDGSGAVPQVRRSGEEPGEEAERGRRRRGRVPRGDQGREGEPDGARDAGNRGMKKQRAQDFSALGPQRLSSR